MSILLCAAKTPSPLAWVVIGIDALIVVVLLLHTLVVALGTKKRAKENTAEARAKVARKLAKKEARIAKKEAKKAAKLAKKEARIAAKAEKKAAKKMAIAESAAEKKAKKLAKQRAKDVAKAEKKAAKKTASDRKKAIREQEKEEARLAKKAKKAKKAAIKEQEKEEKRLAKKAKKAKKAAIKEQEKEEKLAAKKAAKKAKKAAKAEKKAAKKAAKAAKKAEKKDAKIAAKAAKKAEKKAAKDKKERIKQENAEYEKKKAAAAKAKEEKAQLEKIKAEIKKAADEELQVKLKAAEAKAKEEKAKQELERVQAEEKQIELRKQTIEIVMSAVNESVTDLSKKVEEGDRRNSEEMSLAIDKITTLVDNMNNERVTAMEDSKAVMAQVTDTFSQSVADLTEKVEEGDRKNAEELGNAVEKLTSLVESLNSDKVDVEKAIENSQNNVMLQIKEVLSQTLSEINAKIAKLEGNTVAPVVQETVVTEVAVAPVEEVATVEVAEEVQTTEISEDADPNKRVTFAEKMITLDDATKSFYQELDNAFRSYRKVNARVSIRGISYRLGRELIAKITARGKTMRLHLALDVNAFPQNVYFQKDLSDSKAYEEVPFMVKVRSARGLKNALKLIEELAIAKGIEKKARYTEFDSIAELKEYYLAEAVEVVETEEIAEPIEAVEEVVVTEVATEPVEVVETAEDVEAVEEVAETQEVETVEEVEVETTEISEDADPNKRVTFAEKMITLDDATKSFYQELDNAFRSYRKVNARVSIRGISYRLGRELIAKITARGKTMRLHLALDVNAFPQNVYFQKDLSDSKAYEEVPFMVKVRSARGLKNALKLIEELAIAKGIEKKARYTEIDSIAMLSEIANED